MDTENTENTENNNEPEAAGSRPLGYWLRAVDALITEEFAKAFDGEGVTRRDWMLLNAVSGDADVPGFAERLARKGKRLRGLEQRGWVEEAGDGTWMLTDAGRAAKERLGTIVEGVRSRVAGAVAPEDYAKMLASLEAIARELGWDENSRMPRRGFGRGFGPGSGRGFGPGPFGRGFGPGPFGHDIHHDFGPNLHKGFRPGFGPGGGPDAVPDDEDGGHHHHHGHHGHHGEHGHHGHDECGRGHRGGRRGRHGHGAEHAYERGFDAGFARGREA